MPKLHSIKLYHIQFQQIDQRTEILVNLKLM